ncbi:hypothetical protein RF11_05918 [Thelohanellus kitauei]|uniref:Uncharacterized protein n=1 Tax=Thelohanellus kitauei TaxID=669202 RepID=A0A0C2IWU1_THEKT|nr:hypothetical protein RF11_05918 [Thelohanellus kitauei]
MKSNNNDNIVSHQPALDDYIKNSQSDYILTQIEWMSQCGMRADISQEMEILFLNICTIILRNQNSINDCKAKSFIELIHNFIKIPSGKLEMPLNQNMESIFNAYLMNQIDFYS